jgi:hypothetical protein
MSRGVLSVSPGPPLTAGVPVSAERTRVAAVIIKLNILSFKTSRIGTGGITWVDGGRLAASPGWAAGGITRVAAGMPARAGCLPGMLEALNESSEWCPLFAIKDRLEHTP